MSCSLREHARNLVRGKAIPSKLMVQALADTLKMNKVELERLATADRIRAKFGKIPLELSGENPELEPLERVWQYPYSLISDLSPLRLTSITRFTRSPSRMSRSCCDLSVEAPGEIISGAKLSLSRIQNGRRVLGAQRGVADLLSFQCSSFRLRPS